MEGGQSEVEQKQRDQAVGRNPSQLHTAGEAHPPETQSTLPTRTPNTVVEWPELRVTPSFRGRSLEMILIKIRAATNHDIFAVG